jgi:hypothetical protein
MKTELQPTSARRRWRFLLVPGLAVGAVAAAACMGTVGGESGGTSSSGSSGSSSNSNSTSTGGSASNGSSSGSSTKGGNPGTVGLHRLNAFEYDNTVNDLLGLSQQIAEKTFIPDETGTNGFNNEADALTMSDAEFQQYFNAADSLGEQVFASPALIANIIPAATAQNATGLLQVINAFGLRAYRRPLFTDEIARFQALAADAVTNGADFNGQVKQVVKMILTSMPFLYRMEFDSDPTSTTPHPVSGYELASRLSYLLWSSMPDGPLLADAASGAIQTDATLQSEIARMLGSPKANNFVQSFAGQWLGILDVGSHQVEPTAFPSWSEPLRQAYIQEQQLYFTEFLTDGLPWTQFMTAPINFVNGVSAKEYATNSPSAAAATQNIPATQTTMTKVMNMDPNRIGFMGLGGFLTQTSYSYRTVPTLRGKWVLLFLLGESVPSPPNGIPPLDSSPTASTDEATQEENVRARLLAHRAASPTCAACHNRLDPIGLGMENFDGVGAYRSAYGNGQAIDASGQLPDGTTFNGVAQLAQILSKGSRLQELTNFAAQQVMTYALSRPLSLDPQMGTDTPYLSQIQNSWASQNYMLKELVIDVIMNDTFRLRHGGT